MLGLRILKRQRTIDPALVQKYLGLPVANVSDCMARMFAGGAQLHAMHGGGQMAGPAFTVRTRPGDNLMIHKALDLASPGDVIVVDGGGNLINALIGEIMAATAASRGFAGFVINGAIRDAEAIRAGAFPVFACGVTHRGPYKDGPGEINVPVAVDGMVVEPGDLILGDKDGVLCVPYHHAERIYQEAVGKSQMEAELVANLNAGTYDSSWVDATLHRLGCHVEQ